MDLSCGVPLERQSRPSDLISLSIPVAQQYKPSRFNAHTVSADGTLLIYNSLTGMYTGIPSASSQEAERYLSQEGTTAPLTPIGEYLRKRRYIVQRDLDEDGLWDVQYGTQHYRPDVLQLHLLSSEDCNFRCIYCSQDFKRGSMQPHVRKGIAQLVESRIKKLAALHICWFGGEPLLGFDAIQELAPHLQSTANDHDVLFSSQITTNAYLLTPERSRALLDWGVVSYQITIDGKGADHDTHRPLVNGEGTYDTILHNLVHMKHYSDPFTVFIRVNFDQTNVHHLEPLFEDLTSEFGNDKRFEVTFFPVGKWGGPNDDQLQVCGERDIISTLVQLAAQSRRHGLQTDLLLNSLKAGGRSVCYAARPYSFVIGADGKVMKCTEALDTLPENIIGQLSETGDLRLNIERFNKWVKPYYTSDVMCKECFFVPTCQGASCPLPRVLTGKRPCPPTKKAIQQVLKGVWEERSHTAHASRVDLVHISAAKDSTTTTI